MFNLHGKYANCEIGDDVTDFAGRPPMIKDCAAGAGTVTVVLMASFEHDFPFDPAYGYTLQDLLSVPAPAAPDDFDAFWRDRHREARKVATEPELGPPEEERDGVRIHGVTFTSVGGVRLGGWVALPVEGAAEYGFVIGHGYGGREQPGPDVPLPLPRAAAILPCVRGMKSRGLHPGIPDVSAAHVLHGIESRDTYVIGDCVADLWCAASALHELVPELAPGRAAPGWATSGRASAAGWAHSRCPGTTGSGPRS